VNDYFDRIEAHLLDAVERQAARRERPWRRRPAADRREPHTANAGGRAAGRRGRIPSLGIVVSTFAVASAAVVSIVVAVVAIVLVGHGSAGNSAANGPAARQLESVLAVLRRPQTPSDRAFTPPHVLPTPRIRSNGRTHAAAFHAVVVPGLERLATILPGDERVFLVAYRVTSPHPRVGIGIVAYLVRPGAHPVAVAVASPRTLSGPLAGAAGRRARELVRIVPDGVARVRWTFSGFHLLGRVYPGGTVTARVRGNIAAAKYPAQPPGGSNLSGEAWFAADGRVIKTAAGEIVVPGTMFSRPAPETPLSRRAERDPSTPNPISIIPAIGTPTTNAFNVYFRVLVNRRAYSTQVTGGPHVGCAPNYAGDVVAGALRGDLMQFPIQSNPPQKHGFCPGTYRVTVSVLGAHNRPYRPFGSATFTVR
jgi:hypothetical protein